MAENFTRFVLNLAQDPQALAQFHADAPSVMQAANLTPAEQAALTSGNASVIRQALAADTMQEAEMLEAGGIWPITVVVAVTVVVASVEAME